MRRQLVGFVLHACKAVIAAGMEISAKKSVCFATMDDLGKQLQADMAEFGLTFVRKAAALGAGLGAGVRRGWIVLNHRLKHFKESKSSYQCLKRLGSDTASLLRTGGTSALTYGSAVMGDGRRCCLGRDGPRLRRLRQPAWPVGRSLTWH